MQGGSARGAVRVRVSSLIASRLVVPARPGRHKVGAYLQLRNPAAKPCMLRVPDLDVCQPSPWLRTGRQAGLDGDNRETMLREERVSMWLLV